MANEDVKIHSQSHTMKGGDGPLSYAQNSCLQKSVVDATQEMIIQSIANALDMDKLCFDISNSAFRIADFGCSAGPNTFFAVQSIIEAVEKQYQKHLLLEFQVFFNDLKGNDFNTLFRTLPPSQKYFAAGVPGSFYGRLFPKSTIHIAYSSSSLQWLSTIPKDAVDSNSPAWNKGSIYCTGTENEIAKAFSAQYENDMNTFLNARAEELVGGGLMVLLLGGIPDGVPLSQTSLGKLYDLFGSCLVDMAKQGWFSEEKVSSFNLPLYYPSTKKLKALIERNGHFSIEKLDELVDQIKRSLPSIQAYTHIRAGFEGLIQDHFGNEVVEEFFECFSKKYAENRFVFAENADDNVLIFLVLKRKYT